MLYLRAVTIMSCAFFYFQVQAQNPVIPDSILSSTYNELDEKIEDVQDSTLQNMYSEAFLRKAKREGDLEKIFEGYKYKVHFQQDRALRLQYCDSMTYIGKKLNNELLPSAYLTKGALYYSYKDYQQALACYLKANTLLSEKQTPYLFYKSKYCIAEVKYYLGFYVEAIALLNQCIGYFKQEHSRAYLNTLHLLGLSYNKNKQFSLCTLTNKIGLSESAKLGETGMTQYFLHSEGVNLYATGNYRDAILHLEGSLSFLRYKNDFANESVACFYLGKCFMKMGNMEKAIQYFEMVHRIFSGKKYIRQDLLESYTFLTDYYNVKGDVKKELFYSRALLSADSILDRDYKALSLKLQKDYDTREIKTRMQQLENTVARRPYGYVIVSFTLLCTSAIATLLGYRQYKLRKSYFEKFTQIVQKTESTIPEPKGTALPLKKEVADVLYKKFLKFEKEHRYLNKEMNLNKMAILLDSNTKYISQIIHHYRGQKTNEYINSMRIGYIVEQLKHHRKYRNYTLKALASEAGFNNVQSFRKAFLAHNGVPLSFFIEKLKELPEVTDA